MYLPGRGRDPGLVPDLAGMLVLSVPLMATSPEIVRIPPRNCWNLWIPAGFAEFVSCVDTMRMSVPFYYIALQMELFVEILIVTKGHTQ